MHVAIREQEEMAIDPDRKAQIKVQIEAQSGIQSKVKVGALIFNKALTEVLTKYFNYNNVFLAENVAELPENTGMNVHAFELEEDK